MITIIPNTTVTANIAAIKANEGCSTLIVDADRRQNASQWVQQRRIIGPQIGTINGVEIDVIGRHGHLGSVLQDVSITYDHVFVCVPIQDTPEWFSAIDSANLILMPIRQYADLKILFELNNMVKDKSVKGYPPLIEVCAFVNRANKNCALDKALHDLIGQFPNIERLDMVHESAALAISLSSGLGVHELPEGNYDEVSVREIQALSDCINGPYEHGYTNRVAEARRE